MNRLQKKCLIAIAGTHLLLVVALLCSGFITSKPKDDSPEILLLVPVTEGPSSGVPNAHKPPPDPVKPPDPKPDKEPTPDPPKPKPDKTPDPDPPKLDKNPDFQVPQVKQKPHVVVPNLDRTVVKPPKQVRDTTAEDEKRQQRELERQRRDRDKRIASITRSLESSLSTSTTVDMPGESSVSFANYASYVKTVYESAWRPPDDAMNDQAVVKVSVTIGRNGRVVESHVVTPSGDSKLDASVRRTLHDVDFVREFPDGAKEDTKTFIINFNLKSKRMAG